MTIMLLTLLGGSLGALSRYYLGLWLMKKLQMSPIPLAMVVVNTMGSLILGLLIGFMESSVDYLFLEKLYTVVSVGFLAAFTTFSTFSVEAMLLWREKRMKTFLLYISLTLFLSISAFSIGYIMGS